MLGGILGYFIGAFLYDTLGNWLISIYGYGDGVEAFRAAYAEWGAWIILIKGLTPIPFKIVTIASGFAGYDFFMFVLLSTITRGARFFLEAELLRIYGEPIRELHREAAYAGHHRVPRGYCRRLLHRQICLLTWMRPASR